MGIRVEWDNDEKTVIRYVYEERWTWEDFHYARSQVREWLDTVDHRVDVIVDVRNSRLVPNGVLAQGRMFASNAPIAHRNEGHTIVVGANSLMRSMFEMFGKVYSRLSDELELEFASSLEEAREKLRRYQESAG